MIDLNKANPAKMWETLKEIIKGELLDIKKEIDNRF